MSIICLNSKGQSPQNFVNHFPQQIQLGPGAEISVIGYSGRLKGENSTEGVEQIVIERGVNDTLIVYHGKTDIASDDRQRYYQPFPVILEEGTYTASAFATEIALSCNYFECFPSSNMSPSIICFFPKSFLIKSKFLIAE